MKILAFNDIHTDLAAARRLVETSASVDVVVGAGDYSACHEGLEETIAALSKIGKPTVLVPGNNETDRELRKACRGWRSCHVLHGEGVTIDGIRFFGAGGACETPWGWSFDLTEAEFTRAFAACSAADVLVTHAPPRGIMDRRGSMHVGSASVLDAIDRIAPRLHACGHAHEFFGEEFTCGAVRVVNAGPDGCVIEILAEKVGEQ